MRKIYLLVLLCSSYFGYSQTYHPLSASSFTQNWTNTGLITTDNNWSGVPSIIGYRGDDLTTATGTNPQTILADGSSTPVNVIANNTDPNTFTSGGNVEFHITDPVVGFQGSGTADAPHLVIFLNTTGVTNIQVQYKLRDIDGSADNAVQPVALQYRLGTTGNFIDIPAAYIADATSGPSAATQVTNVNVTLPVAAEGQAQIQLRIITANASGTDEFVGIDDINISGTVAGGDVTPPTVSSLSPADDATGVVINPTATITFSETIQKGTGNIVVKKSSDGSIVQTIDVSTSAVSISGAQASFALTLANNTGYYIEVAAEAFKDLANNNFAGITGATTWNFTTVAPPSEGVLGTTYNFNACNNFINQGFKTYSVTGVQVWSCTKFGRTYVSDPSLDSAIEMNGFAGGSQVNEDWLISPKFDLTSTTVPLVDFWSRTNFNGPALSLRVSTNYSGSGDPSIATWTTISGQFPAQGSNVWTLSDSINLSAFKTANVHIAWVYTSTTAGAARWTLDDIKVYNSTVAAVPNIQVNGSLLDFREVLSGAVSGRRSFTFYANDLTSNLTITAPSAFELSKDGTTFTNAISYSPAEASAGILTAYARFAPSAVNTVYSGSLQFSSTGVNRSQIFVKGNSYPKTTTLNVVNWNIEWFGSTASGQGPTDDNLAQANAKKVMEYLDADVYGVSEIVDVTRFANLVSSLAGGYSYVIADFCSGGTTAASCANAQKLALVYKTSLFSNVSARALLKGSTTASSNWSSGRLPFLVTADVTKNGQTQNINFIVIHAKANTGNTAEQIESYQRRKAGVQELKDTLDTHFSTANILVIGDFNDDLDRTIAPTTGADTVSSYQPMIIDSTDANHYKSLTLILSRYGLSSTATNPEVIDHVMASNEMAVKYIALSASLYNDIDSLAVVPNYAETTSDHYPVMTRYSVASVITGFDPVDPSVVELSIAPNPAVYAFNFTLKPAAGKMYYQLVDMFGRVVMRSAVENVNSVKTTRTVNMHAVPVGTYILQIINNKAVIHQKIIKK